MMQLIGAIITLAGAIFLFLGSLGILRMPDVYTRMQAGTKATTLGSILFFIGILFSGCQGSGKIIILILFIIFTNPVSSHALARAVHNVGGKQSDKSVIDQLADKKRKGGKDD
jgi:multicomponent Na+:H+ antiporter subunit G